MNTVNDIFEFLNGLAPVSTGMDFDNVGLLVGDGNAVAERVIIALDITDAVIKEASDLGAKLIVSHHPVIFHEMKSVLPSDYQGRKVIALIKNDIAAICMHTNLDIADGGVNTALAETLGAEVRGFLEPCGRICELNEETELGAFLEQCRNNLNCSGLKYYDAHRPVKHLAVLGGAGASSLSLAYAAGCDTFVTADVKYNYFLEAHELGVNLIDADHFCTENVVVPVLYEKLSARFPDVEFRISEVHKQTAKFFE